MAENDKKTTEETKPTFSQRSGMRELFELFSLTGFVYGQLDELTVPRSQKLIRVWSTSRTTCPSAGLSEGFTTGRPTA
jgi:hypothetical protein